MWNSVLHVSPLIQEMYSIMQPPVLDSYGTETSSSLTSQIIPIVRKHLCEVHLHK